MLQTVESKPTQPIQRKEQHLIRIILTPGPALLIDPFSILFRLVLLPPPVTPLFVIIPDTQRTPQLLGFLNLRLGELVDLMAFQAPGVGSRTLCARLFLFEFVA